jgi:hypothetical protein
MTYKFTKEQIQDAIESTSINGNVSMRKSAEFLNVKLDTFRKYAKLHDLWLPNTSGKGRKKSGHSKILLSEILEGKHPQYQSHKLKLRLISELGWKHCCSSCGLSNWLTSKIPLELDHIDGNKFNNKIENLRLLCPNCHALTDTYCAKNKGNYGASGRIRTDTP